MERSDRIGRTARLLEARLEFLAAVSERSLDGERPYDVQIHAVAAATRHAVALQILSPEHAGAIWSAVAKRHPGARWCGAWPSVAV